MMIRLGSYLEALGQIAESASRFTEVVGRIQLLIVVGLRSPFPYWLLSGNYFQLSGPGLRRLHLVVENFRCIKCLSSFEFLWLLLLPAG